MAIDFSKAYDSVLHPFASAVMKFLGFHACYVKFLIFLMQAPLVFQVGREVVQGMTMNPGSGIRQGGPLSLALFSMLMLVLVYDLKRLNIEIRVLLLLYADDILLIFDGSGRSAKADVRAALYVINVFGYFSGLKINASKLYVLYKSATHAPPSSIADLKVVPSLRYLGMQLGHLTSEEAYAPVIQKMMGRARFLSNLPLSLQEKTEVFTSWVQPVVFLTARAYYPIP